MASQRYEIRWYGPYSWYGTKDDSFFIQPVSKKSGVYLLAIPFKNGYLTYYVGETGRPFATRLIEHARYYLHGLYRIFDPRQFAEGKKELVWGGMWKPGTKGPRRMLEFLNRYSELSPLIYEFLGMLKIFVAPLDVEKRIRERIEAAIANRLYQQPGVVGKFQDDDIKYRPRRTDEEPFSVRMGSFETILGLCSELTA